MIDSVMVAMAIADAERQDILNAFFSAVSICLAFLLLLESVFGLFEVSIGNDRNDI